MSTRLPAELVLRHYEDECEESPPEYPADEVCNWVYAIVGAYIDGLAPGDAMYAKEEVWSLIERLAE